MIDWYDSMENAAEMRLDEMTKGLTEGKFRCYCGEIDDLDNAMSESENPYSPPICGKCFKKASNGKNL